MSLENEYATLQQNRKKAYAERLRRCQREAEKHAALAKYLLDRLFPHPEARWAADAIGHGMRLCVPRSSEGIAKVIRIPVWPAICYGEWDNREISREAVEQLLASEQFSELPEHTTNWKVGCRENRLPFDEYRVYAFIR